MVSDTQKIFDQSEQTGVDIKKYLFKGLSYWYLFVIIVPAAYFIAHWVNKFAVPTYGLHTTVMIKNETNEEGYAGGLQLFAKRKNLDTQKGILKSYSLNKKAIEALEFDVTYYKKESFRSDYELYKNTPFIVKFDTSYNQYNNVIVDIVFKSNDEFKLRIESFDIEKDLKVGQQFVHGDFSFKIELSKKNPFNKNIVGNEYYFYKNSSNSLINSYTSRLEVDVSPERSSILWLWIVGTVPQKDADYLNKLVEVYIKQGLDEKNAHAVSVIEFIDSQLEGVSDSLNKTENNLQIFKQKNNTLDISSEGEMLIEKLSKSEGQLITEKTRLSYYKYLFDETSNSEIVFIPTMPSVMQISDPLLSTYFSNLAEAYTERDILKFNVKGDLPNTEILDFKISKIKNQINKHSEKTIEVTNTNIETIKRQFSRIDREVKRLPANERRIISIQRKFNINDAIYTLLLQRRMEAAITQASNKADTKELDPARPENAVWKGPNTAGNKRKAIIFGFVIPILIIVVIEFFNTKIEDISDIEKRTTVPVLGTINNNNKDTNLPVTDSPKSPIAESFRLLRTNLQYIVRDKEPKVIAVTSTVGGEGKSFISANLASIMALSGKKTLLIGLDLRKPKLQHDFKVNNEIGVSTFLINHSSYEEIIQSTETDNLYICLSGPSPPNPAELIESDKMTELIKSAKKDFEYIIIDTPPVAIVTDALLLSDIANAYLYIVRQNYSNKNVLKLIEDLQKNITLKNLSIVLNDAKISMAYVYKYGYNYGYGYRQGYYDDDQSRRRSWRKRIIQYFRK